MTEKAYAISSPTSHFIDKQSLEEVKKFSPGAEGAEGPAELFCLLIENAACSLYREGLMIITPFLHQCTRFLKQAMHLIGIGKVSAGIDFWVNQAQWELNPGS